ncbi:MAG: PDZ domain-containing protein [Actinomycetota bacterium]
MWPDEEWEDEPGGGDLPDPATRHWRHPSEIGSMGLGADAEELTAVGGGKAPETAWRWPAGALGGGLAVVALGAIGLSMANTRTDSLNAGSVPALSAPAANTAQGVFQEVTTTSFELLSADTGVPTTSVAPADRWTASSRPSPSTPPSTAHATPFAAEALADSADGRISSEPLTAPAPGMLGPFGPAVYAEPDADRLLGSFVAVDDLVLTSARALDGLDQVYLLIDQSWIPATVVGSDPRSDVAVLAVDPALWDLGLPSDRRVAEPIGPDTTIFVGYCPRELLMQVAEYPAVRAGGCGPVKPVMAATTTEPDGDEAAPGEPVDADGTPAGPGTAEDTTTADDPPNAVEPPGADASGGSEDDPAADNGDTTAGTAVDGTDETDNGDTGGRNAAGQDPSDNADPADDDNNNNNDNDNDNDNNGDQPTPDAVDPEGPSVGDDQDRQDGSADGTWYTSRIQRRLGNVWSTTQTVDRVFGHNVYDLIKTSVPKHKEMAGAALRNTAGEVVGLVVAAETPNVAALPIDRALDVARAILANGSGSNSWFGLRSAATNGGVWIRTVDETGPAAGLLEPGDRLLAMDGQAVQDLDHLVHLMRLARAGEPVEFRIVRDRELLLIELVAGEVPTAED